MMVFFLYVFGVHVLAGGGVEGGGAGVSGEEAVMVLQRAEARS